MAKLSMDKKILIEFTRHLILASRPKLSVEKKEEKRPVLIQRLYSQPQVPIIPPTMHFPIQAAPKAVPAQPKPELKEEIWDLGKITKFSSDKSIEAIECLGSETPVKIKRGNSIFSTDIKLNDDEIKAVIEKFSAESKVPVEEVFRASAKGWQMTAISSPMLGFSFVMKRI